MKSVALCIFASLLHDLLHSCDAFTQLRALTAANGTTPWVVGNATFDVAAGNSFNSSLSIHHTIGDGPDQVNVVLYKYDCETIPNGTDANLVIISNKKYADKNNTLSYDIDVNKTLISSSSMVTFDKDINDGKSIGVVKFCTKVTTILSSDANTTRAPLNVSFRKTNFLLSFDLTDNTFSGGSFGVQADEIIDMDVDVEDAYDVEVCQCAIGSFDCVKSTPPPAILQDEKVAICLNTSSTEVVLSNFNLRMTNSDTQYFYEPVTMGSGAWAVNSDSLTTVFKDGNKLRIETFVVQGLFKNNEAVNTISVSGNAYLEFVSSQKDAEDTKDSLVAFEMNLVGEPKMNDEGVGGCINTIVAAVSSFFE